MKLDKKILSKLDNILSQTKCSKCDKTSKRMYYDYDYDYRADMCEKCFIAKTINLVYELKREVDDLKIEVDELKKENK